MSASNSWLALAKELLEALPARPDDAEPDEERLDWRLRERLAPFVEAASVKPSGVKAAECKEWPRVLADRPVTLWLTQEELAGTIGRDTRTLRRWAARGLPSFGDGAARRYPYPHGLVWSMAYTRLKQTLRTRVLFLPLDIAFAEQARSGAYITSGHRLELGHEG